MSDFMIKTSWPFVEWTEKVGKRDVELLIIREEVLVGNDVVNNTGTLTKVEMFSSLFRPHALSIEGKKVRGIIAENKEGEYFFYALLEDAYAGEKLELKVTIEGNSTIQTLREDGYYSNFAWNSRHVQRIIFPRGWKILLAIPNGYVVETSREISSIRWNRGEKFRGDVQVNVEKRLREHR
jgi:hypothetical protein